MLIRFHLKLKCKLYMHASFDCPEWRYLIKSSLRPLLPCRNYKNNEKVVSNLKKKNLNSLQFTRRMAFLAVYRGGWWNYCLDWWTINDNANELILLMYQTFYVINCCSANEIRFFSFTIIASKIWECIIKLCK